MIDAPLPDLEAVATLVSGVTETMFKLPFALEHADGTGVHHEDATQWRTLGLVLSGQRPLLVAISSDGPSGRQLASTMFQCELSEVDAVMVDDAIGELVNILAGQLKLVMGLDDDIGLPHVVSVPVSGESEAPRWRAAFLRSNQHELRVWVALSELARSQSA
jgi:hypothetical protein